MRIVACIKSVVLSYVLSPVSDAYVHAWAVQAQAKGAGAVSQGSRLSRARIVARISGVLWPYERPIRAHCTIRSQYSNYLCDGAPAVSTFVYEMTYLSDTPVIHTPPGKKVGG